MAETLPQSPTGSSTLFPDKLIIPVGGTSTNTPEGDTGAAESGAIAEGWGLIGVRLSVEVWRVPGKIGSDGGAAPSNANVGAEAWAGAGADQSAEANVGAGGLLWVNQPSGAAASTAGGGGAASTEGRKGSGGKQSSTGAPLLGRLKKKIIKKFLRSRSRTHKAKQSTDTSATSADVTGAGSGASMGGPGSTGIVDATVAAEDNGLVLVGSIVRLFLLDLLLCISVP